MNVASDSDRLQGVRAIIVEDSFVAAETLEALLESYGCRVIGKAANVATGLVLAGRPDYEVAVLDVRLGEDLVTEVARKVREHGKRIVYLTGYSDLAFIPADLLSYPILAKPVRPAILIEALLTKS